MKLSKWVPVVGWMAVIFILSAQTQLPTPEQRWLDYLLEKSAHGFEYGILAALVGRAMGPEGIGRWRAFGVSVLVAWLYALSDEFHQSFVPGRAADWSDIFFDWSGAVLGAWLWRITWATRRRKALAEDA